MASRPSYTNGSFDNHQIKVHTRSKTLNSRTFKGFRWIFKAILTHKVGNVYKNMPITRKYHNSAKEHRVKFKHISGYSSKEIKFKNIKGFWWILHQIRPTNTIISFTPRHKMLIFFKMFTILLHFPTSIDEINVAASLFVEINKDLQAGISNCNQRKCHSSDWVYYQTE